MRKSEFALRASEQRYRQLLNSVDKGILVTNAHGQVVSAAADEATSSSEPANATDTF